MGEGGYDGKGVQMIRTTEDIDKGFDGPAVLEKMVSIQKEIAQMVAINEKGETALYPPVEMLFDPVLNLLDYQLCPAELNTQTLYKVEAIALAVVRNFKSPGIFAVEMFIDKNGDVLVNETAPRVHNSGHHTIEAHYCSQFDMLWRIMLGYPLGNTDAILPSIMVNIIGAEGYSGDVKYEGLEEVLKIENALFIFMEKTNKTRPKNGACNYSEQRKTGTAAPVKQNKSIPCWPNPSSFYPLLKPLRNYLIFRHKPGFLLPSKTCNYQLSLIILIINHTLTIHS